MIAKGVMGTTTGAFATLAIACGAMGCQDWDTATGVDQRERLAFVIADEQPADPTHGVLAEIVGYGLRPSEVEVDVVYGTIRRGTEIATDGFCESVLQPLETASGSDPGTFAIPVIVLPVDTEAIALIRLLDAVELEADAAVAMPTCTGRERKTIQVLVRAGATPSDDPDAAPATIDADTGGGS